MSGLKAYFLDEIEKIPGVEHRYSPVLQETALFFHGKEFAHFHHSHELDIKLGRSLIKREGLSHPQDSEKHPTRSLNSQWIEIRFNSSSEAQALVRLVGLFVDAFEMKA
jgi:hypothetical protein